MDRIYLDYNATTPVAPEVVQAMLPFLQSEFGNPSSHHWAGQRAHAAVDKARQQVSTLLQCKPSEIVFTSGGTEANNMALAGAYFAQKKTARPEIIISSIEHPSIVKMCDFLRRLGAEIKHIPVDRTGLVDPDDVRSAITADTILISIMHANNEVGTVQPIGEIAAIAREHQIPFHTDAAQSVGKLPVHVNDLNVDLLTIAGHKMYAPQGIGVLYIREGTQIEPWLYGGGQENGRRSGTEAVAMIAGLGAACELAESWIHRSTVRELTNHFWRRLSEQFGDRVVLNGHSEQRLPNTLNVSFRGQLGQAILSRVPLLAASTGSACHAESQQISPVLRAMGIADDVALGAIRFSLGRSSTLKEIDTVIGELTFLQ